MGILGIGVDIVKTQRIADIIRRRGSSRFATKILSAEELRDWQDVIGSQKEAPFLAVR
jgi:holo-[acyl-carrier protein] synthase